VPRSGLEPPAGRLAAIPVQHQTCGRAILRYVEHDPRVKAFLEAGGTMITIGTVTNLAQYLGLYYAARWRPQTARSGHCRTAPGA
jgi:hypothetical protein